jgi:hypothetical protein
VYNYIQSFYDTWRFLTVTKVVHLLAASYYANDNEEKTIEKYTLNQN